MADETQRDHDDEQRDPGAADVAGLRAWAAVTVRQAHELWPHARNDPAPAELRLVIEHLTTIERLLPTDDPARAAVVCWLGLLLQVRIVKDRTNADRQQWAAAVTHLRWADRAGPLEDPLAMTAREHLAELLVPPGIPQQLRDGSMPPDLVDPLRRQLQEAMNVLARVVVGDLSTRERVLAAMEHVAELMALVPGPPPEASPMPEEGPRSEAGPPLQEAQEKPQEPREPQEIQQPAGEPLTAAVQAVLHWALQDAVRCAHLLEWLWVTVNLPWVPLVDARGELVELGLDQLEFAPLYELLAALRSNGQDPRSLAGPVQSAARAAGEALLACPAGTPERIRAAKFHAALLVVGNLRVPEMLDFGEVDGAALLPDPDPAARAVWRREVSLELYLSIAIDNLWVSNGEVARVERSVAWLKEWLGNLPEDDRADTVAARRHLTSLLTHRVSTAAALGGSLQDGAAALSMAEELTGTGERDDIQRLLSIFTGSQMASSSRDRAAQLRVADGAIRTLSAQYGAPAPDEGTRFVITATLGSAHSGRAALTGDQADFRAAARYLREVVETDPATLGPLYAPYFPTTRAQAMTELAKIDPRREVIDRAIAEVHRVIDETHVPPREESRLRLALGQVMLRTITDRSDLSLLDPCLAELNRVRALAAAGHAPPLTVEVLTELSTAYWMSAVTGTSHESEDWRSSLDTRREALEQMAVDVLLQLGAEHALSVARAATGHALWLALRCAEYHQPAEAVEALELGRALVLQTAAGTHGVPRLLTDRGHPELAEQWRTQTPNRASQHPFQQEPQDIDRHEIAPGADHHEDAPSFELPSSTRRKALAALGAGDGTGARKLLDTPDVTALTAALAASGADALVYLVPGEGFRPHIPGHALVLRPGGTEPTLLTLPLLLAAGSHQLERYLTAAAERSRGTGAAREAAEAEWQAALSELCDWAWPAAVGPVLDTLKPLGRAPRIVLIPCGPLGVVPWHAARKHIPLGGHRYACQDAVFSYAPSGAQFLRAAARDRLPATGHRVLVTDPSLSLVWAEVETEALRAGCYPDARRYGEFAVADGTPDAPGTCEDLLTVLPGGDRPAAIVHVSCHGVAGPSPTRSALSLADGDLTVARILDHTAAAAPGLDGPLVVLSGCETDLSTGDHDEALTLSTALVARGAADVVGSRWAVDDSATALMMAAFHHFLAGKGLAPADALRAAQLWMLDPDREPPPGMDGPLSREAARVDLHATHLWAAFTHQGNPAPH